jgi:hypothetical protein
MSYLKTTKSMVAKKRVKDVRNGLSNIRIERAHTAHARTRLITTSASFPSCATPLRSFRSPSPTPLAHGAAPETLGSIRSSPAIGSSRPWTNQAARDSRVSLCLVFIDLPPHSVRAPTVDHFSIDPELAQVLVSTKSRSPPSDSFWSVPNPASMPRVQK